MWLTDISEHRAGEAKVYLCAVKDVLLTGFAGPEPFSAARGQHPSRTLAARHPSRGRSCRYAYFTLVCRYANFGSCHPGDWR